MAPIYVWQTLVCKGGTGTPWGKCHTYQYEECVCTPMCAMGMVGPLWGGGRGLLEASLPLLDTLVSLGPNNTIITSVYRKRTHTDKYLKWHSNHNLPAKYSIYNILAHRARVVCTSQLGLKQEEDYISHALLRCNYPPYALNSLHTKINYRFSTNQTHIQDSWQQTNNNNGKIKNHNIFF